MERIGYRFVFDPIDARSFEIPAQRDTDRWEDNPTCPQCALSMYTTIEAAKAAFRKLLEKHPKIAGLLGGHIAEVGLLPAHGVQTNPNSLGHFALHEYDGVDLVPIAVPRGSLVE